MLLGCQVSELSAVELPHLPHEPLGVKQSFTLVTVPQPLLRIRKHFRLECVQMRWHFVSYGYNGDGRSAWEGAKGDPWPMSCWHDREIERVSAFDER
jgi:hypothetical protein